MTILHVAITGTDAAAGTESAPFRTINHAAQVALPGTRSSSTWACTASG